MLRALDLTKSYDGAPLFEGLSLTLNPGERAGLVGPNGAGKSTLLRLLAGARAPRPRLDHHRPRRVGYLPQEAPAATRRSTTLLHDALGEAGEALAALRTPAATSTRYAHALERAEATGAWAAEARAEEIRRRLGIEHLPTATGRCSASRAASRPARCWPRRCSQDPARPAARRAHQPPRRRRPRRGSRSFLAGFDGALLVVSHDRRFLDAVVTRIHELGADGA